MARRRGRTRKPLTVNTDLKLMPLMNIIIALIPMLLLTAVFIEVQVIETGLPRDAGAAAAEARPAAPPLDLAVHVRKAAYIIEGHGLEPRVLPRLTKGSTPDSTTMDQITAILRAGAATRPGTSEVRIVAESRTHYQEIISLMDAARAAGLPNAALEGSPSEEV
jgi:biopolymer transport protein ExbD